MMYSRYLMRSPGPQFLIRKPYLHSHYQIQQFYENAYEDFHRFQSTLYCFKKQSKNQQVIPHSRQNLKTRANQSRARSRKLMMSQQLIRKASSNEVKYPRLKQVASITNFFQKNFHPKHFQQQDNNESFKYIDIGLNQPKQKKQKPMEFMMFGLNAMNNTNQYDFYQEDPKQILSKCQSMTPPHAISPVYINNQYVRVGVQVKAYNQLTKKWTINVYKQSQVIKNLLKKQCRTKKHQMPALFKEKEVHRLSLMFLWENQQEYFKRVQLCKQRQQAAADQIFFEKQVLAVNDRMVPELPASWRLNILRKTFKRKNVSKPSGTIKALLSQVQMVFKNFIKKFIILIDMSLPQNKKKWKNKKRRNRYQPKRFKRNGVIELFSHNFQDLVNTVKQCPSLTNKNIQQTFFNIFQKIIFFSKVYMVQTEINQKFIPMKLQAFVKLQKQKFELSSSVISMQMRQNLVSLVMDNLKNQFHFYQTNLKQFYKSYLPLFINKMDQIVRYYVQHGIIYQNFIAWLSFIKSYSDPQQGPEFWKMKTKPLIQVTLNLSLEIRKQKRGKRSNKKKKTMNPLNLDNINNIVFQPNLQEIINGIWQPLQRIFQFACNFEKLNKQTAPLIELKSRKYLNEADFNFYLMETRKQIEQYIKKQFQLPISIAKRFAQFIYIVQNNLNQSILTKLFVEHINLIFLEKDQINDKLDEITNDIKIIESLEVNQVNNTMFSVNISNLKASLIKHGNQTKNSILEKIYQLIKASISTLDERYINIRESVYLTMEQESQMNEDVISTLKKNISLYNIEILKLQNDWKLVNDFFNILEKHSFIIDNQTYKLYYLLLEEPSKILEAVDKGSIQLQLGKSILNQQLDKLKVNFNLRLQQLKLKFHKVIQLGVRQYNENWIEPVRIVGLFKNELQNLQQDLQKINKIQNILQVMEIDFQLLTEMLQKIEPYSKMWSKVSQFNSLKDEWQKMPVSQINLQDVEKKMKEFARNFNEFKKEPEQLGNKGQQVSIKVLEQIQQFNKMMWLITCTTIEVMKKRGNVYWKQILKECNIVIESNQILSLKFLIDKGITQHKEVVLEITNRADKQYKIEKKITKIIEQMKEKKLDLLLYKKTNTYVLKNTQQLFQFIDQQLNNIQIIKASSLSKTIMPKIKALEQRLLIIQQTIDQWIHFQKGWMYLEPIFSSEDIKEKMSQQKQKFDILDSFYRNIVKLFEKDAAIYQQIQNDKIKLDFQLHNKLLQQILKSLTEFLGIKRQYFSRFFFLSDQQLLQILSQTKDPLTVQNHIFKCFEGIDKLLFKQSKVCALISSYKEVLKLDHQVDVNEGQKKGNVEIWLKEIEHLMVFSIKGIIQQSMKDTTERTKWILKWPQQIVLCVNMLKWTNNAEQAFRNFQMSQYLQTLNQQLRKTVEMVRYQLTQLQTIILGSLITIDVHTKDIIQQLVNNQITDQNNFNWRAQLKYYSYKTLKDFMVKVKIINAQLSYSSQYLGNSTRLVITPLTDRCYRTLLGAYHLFYGGAPQGPAGTGKTQTVKDLSKAVAVRCVVFNCSNQLNFWAMSKFFKGLASSGSWCCFDQFNRIDLEVLSVIAQQVLTIQTAIKEKKKKFLFDEQEIELLLSCAINITMNPGYAGRSQLPDNLKALFRPCAMMVPDYTLISQIHLYSVGFQEARELARKIVASLKLSSEQLSSQDHYDFGMRALKAILTASGFLKRVLTNQSEDIICLRALISVNLPKFTISDVPLFKSIINDLFPGVENSSHDYGFLEEHLQQAASKQNLLMNIIFQQKCIQLYDTIKVRHGLMLVGETFSGKSTVLKTLGMTMGSINDQKEYYPTKIIKLNPKSITLQQLYGKLDPDSRSWTDGVIGIIIRECALDIEVPEKKWVVFDGPVDAVWIQNMNTVLDDNKMLCLISGQIIKLTQWMTIMFQVQDLMQASPATVSRCGMVFMQSNQISLECMLYGKEELKGISILPQFLQICLSFIRQYGKFPVAFIEMSIVNNFIKLYKSMKEKDQKKNINWMLFVGLWVFGGVLDQNSRKKFNQFISKLITANYQILKIYNIQISNYVPFSIDTKIPEKNNLFDYFYSPGKGWFPWTQKIRYTPPQKAKFHQIIVPTADSVRNSHITEHCIKNSIQILLAGSTGTAKTVTVKSVLKQHFNNQKYGYFATSFSGQTTANQIQRIIESKINSRRRKNVFGPCDSKRLYMIFIDDINMPTKEKYGAQPPIELLRQWLDIGGWYDLDNKQFKELKDMVIVGAMMHTGNLLSNRFIRFFNLLFIQSFESLSYQQIFSTILNWFFGIQKYPFSRQITILNQSIVKATLEIYYIIQQSKEFFPTPAKSHYIYNMRDISKVFQGICKTESRAIQEQNDFISLWVHQSLRVFHDRLINKADQQLFISILKQLLIKHFKKQSFDFSTPLLFCGFIPTIYPENDHSKKPLNDIYCQQKDIEHVRMHTQKMLVEYNNYCKPMQIVLFVNAIQHVLRILRIVECNYGHCLLLGLGGSGRKSLASLATFIAFSTDIVRIDQKEWNQQLQKLLKSIGIEIRQQVMLVEDNQITNEILLQDICNLLNSGEIPNLFTKEQKQKIVEELSVPGMENQKFAYFIQKCKQNLHVVFCMSPIGQRFRKRLRIFPALINCTSINWFLEWPQQALKSTGINSLKQQIQFSSIERIVESFVKMHVSIRSLSQQYLQQLRSYYYVTPTSYLQLLQTFKKIKVNREKFLSSMIVRYRSGIQKIISTQKKVQEMKAELTQLKPKLQKATQQNSFMLQNLQKKRKQAQSKRFMCQAEEKQCNIKRKSANSLKQHCQLQLNKVLPTLLKASQALKKIKKKDLDFLKSLKVVPYGVQLVFQGLCYALDEDENVKWKPKQPGSFEKVKDFWDFSKRNLLNMELCPRIQKIKKEDIQNMKSEKIKKLEIFVNQPDFQQKVIFNASQAAYNLSMWIRALIDTFNALLIVKPKEEQLNQAQNHLFQAQEQLSQKKKNLEEVLNLLQTLQKEYELAKEQKQNLQKQVREVESKLDVAEKLTKGLSVQKNNWNKKMADFINQQTYYIGDSVISSGIIVYLGAFPLNYREKSIANWKIILSSFSIKFGESYSFQTLSDPITIGKWVNQQKLPNDEFSIDNAIIMHNSNRWPLFIDPQEQAIGYIKAMQQENFKTIKMTMSPKQVFNMIEKCLAYNIPILLQDIGQTINPIFKPILQKQFYKDAGDWKIRVGDRVIDFDLQFKFYIFTKLCRPHFIPQIYIRVTVLNFQVTYEGLQDQILNIVVKIQQPLKEQYRQKNIRQFFQNKTKQKITQDGILKRLSETEGDILGEDKKELIEFLDNSKIESLQIQQKLKKQEYDKQTFNQIRNFYKSVAKRISSLYFVILDLASIQPTYQWSLKFYVMLFEKAIVNSDPRKTPQLIIKNFQEYLYLQVCRSLLEKDKLLFSFMIAIKIMLSEGEISGNEIRFLMVGGTKSQAICKKPEEDWISNKMWCSLQQYSEKIANFKPIFQQFHFNIQYWNQIYQEQKISNIKWYKPFTQFQKLILLRILKPELLIRAIQNLIITKLGSTFIENPPFNLQKAFQSSKPNIPLIFILSSGADPRQQIMILAQKLGVRHNLKLISLGQGQQKIASSSLKLSFEQGNWILLQNCHLAPSFMPILERLFENMTKQVNLNFRLWLTSMPSNDFPVNILMEGIKMTFQPPRGLKNNLLRSYLSQDPKKFEQCEKVHEWKKLFFGLSFFHALILERRNYGPLGWNIPYQFTIADFIISVSQLKMFLNQYKEIPWQTLNYLVSEANYGGRVTDPQDRRLIKTILSEFFCPMFLQNKFKISHLDSYQVPHSNGGLDFYKQFVREFPLNTPTQVFGLHENAEISSAILQTNFICATILDLLPRNIKQQGKSTDQIIKEKIQEIFNKLPIKIDIDLAKKNHPVCYQQSMNTVLHQQIYRYLRLLSKIHQSLNQLKMAIQGLHFLSGSSIMTSNLQILFNNIFDNKVPDIWHKVSFPSLKPLGFWINDLIKRIDFINQWINDGIPKCFWISGFFFTQSFLTGNLQNYARKMKFAIDTLSFRFQVMTFEIPKKEPQNGCYIYGLYLDGSRWNEQKRILDNQRHKVLFERVPVINFIPSKQESSESQSLNYECPVYKTSIRRGTLSTTGHSTNYIISIKMPIEGQSEKWIKRGTAMITQLDNE